MIENGTITTITLEDFKSFSSEIGYVDDDFLVITKIEKFPDTDAAFRSSFFMMICCVEGRMQLEMNGTVYSLEANDAIICLPSVILSRMLFSPHHQVRIIGLSTGFLKRTLKHETNTENIFLYTTSHPIIHFNINTMRPDYYSELILQKLQDAESPYRRDILEHLFSACLFELLNHLDKTMEDAGIQPDSEIKRPTYVFKRFLEEVAKDNGMHRSVDYYAAKICYSPKYVSYVVKRVSGRTASEWINEEVIEHIKHLLKHTDKSVKEIAEILNFPNQSFFGKYVKKHLGMSPAKYRMN